MNRLIEAFEALLTTATLSGGDLCRTADFALQNVNWKSPLSKHDPTRQTIVDTYLESACASSSPHGSSSHELAVALLAAADQLQWRVKPGNPADGPDVVIFSRNFSATTIIGAGGLLPSNKVTAGFSLQGRNTYYPPHAHHAEESYWIIGGDGNWKVGTQPWFGVEPGDSIYHASGARHAMQTNEQPLLAVWLWTSHLDSEVVIVRA